VSTVAPRPEPGTSDTPIGSALELLALGTGLVLVMGLLARLPPWSAELGRFQALYLVAFAFYALAVVRAGRFRFAPSAPAIVLAVAAAARLALLPVTPSLSDDLYRYVWEGRVAALGFDPYRFAPLAPELAPLRDAVIFPRVNHPELSSIYPPFSMAGFALVAALSPTVIAMKLWNVLHDLALVGALLAWMRRKGLGPEVVIAYAWCPLVLVEYAGNGHNDPTAMLWLVLALMWVDRRPTASALAFAAGALTKLAPLAALPFLIARWPWRARLLAAGATGAGLLAYWRLTRVPSSGLDAYWHTWRNNDLVFHYLAAAVGSETAARWLAAGIVCGVALVAFARGASPGDGTRSTLRAALLTGPVAHPWYFGWALALEPLGPSGGWLLLSLTCVLSYGFLVPPAEGGSFHAPLSWRWIEYGAPLALGVALALWARRRRGSGREAARLTGR